MAKRAGIKRGVRDEIAGEGGVDMGGEERRGCGGSTKRFNRVLGQEEVEVGKEGRRRIGDGK